MLQIHEVALQLIREVAPLAIAIGRHDNSLAKQFRDAMSSVPLNVAEGSDARGARRTSHYQIALGSAREALSALRTAGAWGYIDDVPPSVVSKFDNVIGVLSRNIYPRR